jgi:hypothetical protein
MRLAGGLSCGALSMSLSLLLVNSGGSPSSLAAALRGGGMEVGE